MKMKQKENLKLTIDVNNSLTRFRSRIELPL